VLKKDKTTWYVTLRRRREGDFLFDLPPRRALGAETLFAGRAGRLSIGREAFLGFLPFIL